MQDGTVVSIGVSFIICVVWTLIAPEKDKNAWARFKGIEIEDNESVRRLLWLRLPYFWSPCHARPSWHMHLFRLLHKSCVWGLLVTQQLEARLRAQYIARQQRCRAA